MAARATASAFTIAPCSYEDAQALAVALDISEPVAMTLVRRGYSTASAARDFLDATETHDPFEFDRMEEVVELLLRAARRGERITVHGDYDVDGVCSTAILVAALRQVGAECDWHLPDRLADGYGLTSETVRMLAARGTRVLLTADCGITCADEVALATELGLAAIVTDHHEPGERLPDCLLLHPRVSGYPFEELCATGVAHKLAEALRERAGANAADARSDLDLVALATVADLVPLRGENRSLVRAGLVEARRSDRRGMRALIAAAGIDAERIDEGDLAFRLAPRINAAGRLYRADGGVELMLTEDDDRAAAIAADLERANRERRQTEREAVAGAERALAALPDELREGAAIVVAGEGWHPGVVGIVASRLVERHWRPAIVLGIDGDGRARGSGRSVPGFDLLAGLRACDDHLDRFGGHAAAAGLELPAQGVEGFRSAFCEHAASVIEPGASVRTEAIDAIVGGESLGLAVAEDFCRLAPFGKGNPEPRLLVPAARVRDVRPMGEGKHARFSLESGAKRAAGVAFGVNGELDRAAAGGPLDVTVRLEVNHWNGAVEPRVVLGELHSSQPLSEKGGCSTPAERDEWWSRFDAMRSGELGSEAPWEGWDRPSERTTVDRRGGSGVACVAALLAGGAGVLALCADSSRRRALAESAAAPERFGGGAAVLACGRCGREGMRERVAKLADAGPGLVLADWGALALVPELPECFGHVVAIDPPPFADLERALEAGSGYLHLAWGAGEVELALRVHDLEWPLRPTLAGFFATIRTRCAQEPLRGIALAEALAGDGPHPRTPEQAARSVRVLEELGLLAWQGSGTTRTLGVVSSEATNLERSAAYRAYRDRHEEGRRFLTSKRQR